MALASEPVHPHLVVVDEPEIRAQLFAAAQRLHLIGNPHVNGNQFDESMLTARIDVSLAQDASGFIQHPQEVFVVISPRTNLRKQVRFTVDAGDTLQAMTDSGETTHVEPATVQHLIQLRAGHHELASAMPPRQPISPRPSANGHRPLIARLRPDAPTTTSTSTPRAASL